MLGDGRGALGVAVGHGIIIHVVAELIAQGDGLGMVVIFVSRLVGEGGIEGVAFVMIRLAIPDTGASRAAAGDRIRITGVDVGEGVPHVEHRHAVDHAAACSKAC